MRTLAFSTVMLFAFAAAVQAQVKPDLSKNYDYIRRAFAKSYIFSECRRINNPFTEEEIVKIYQIIKEAKKTDESNVIAVADDLMREVHEKYIKDGRMSREVQAAICREMLEFALR